MMRKWLAFLLACAMLLGSTAVIAEEVIFDDEETATENDIFVYTGPEYDYDHLVTGHTTALSGGFSTQMWGGNTADLDVSALLNGYNLIRYEYELGGFIPDESVVTNAEQLFVTDDEEGNRSYYFTLASDLYYSDGTPITAWDYAFSILLQVSKEAAALDADTDRYPCLVGMQDYREGNTNVLTGVSVPDEHMIILTVSHGYRPFFYELGYLWCYPMPAHIIAPDCQVKDDGEGCYIDGTFTSEVLKETMLNPETGYRTFPAAVSGPYQLTGFDGVTAEFEINPYYKGNYLGIQPQIQYLTYTLTENETMIQKLEEGTFGLINKTLRADTITEGMELVATGNYAMASYPRIGQSHISFCTEKAAVNSQNVRQAIAFCLDKEQLVSDYSGNFGIRVDGYYGIGQWMYRVLTGSLGAPVPEPEETASAKEIKEYEELVEQWEALLEEVSPDDLKKYDLDVEKAIQLLEEDGWTLNRNGESFVAGTDDVRCKEFDGELVALDLTMIYPEGNVIVDYFEETFVPYLNQAGIALTMVPVEMNELREILHRDVERNVDMIYLATNFDEVFNPMPTFDPADAETGHANYTAINDEKLYELVVDMDRTEPGDNYSYFIKWLAFQDYYMDVLPELPVYGNAYFDFFTACLQNYNPAETVTWSEAIVAAYMSDPMLVEEEEEEEAEDGTVIFD